MKVRPGYWVPSVEKVEHVHKCGTRVTTDTLLNHDPVPGWKEALDNEDSLASMRCPALYAGDEGCTDNRTGPLCGRCMDGYYKDATGCIACDGKTSNVGMILTVLVIVLLILPFVAYAVFNGGASEYTLKNLGASFWRRASFFSEETVRFVRHRDCDSCTKVLFEPAHTHFFQKLTGTPRC